MKKTFILIIACLTVFISCAPLTPQPQTTGPTGVDKKQHFIDLKQTVTERGFITIDELKELDMYRFTKVMRGVQIWSPRGKYWEINPEPAVLEAINEWTPYIRELLDVLNTVVEKDLLPFNAMLYLALEKENYDEAENIKLFSLNWLKGVEECNGIARFERFKIAEQLYVSVITKNKVSQQIKKLTSVVGLTDPMLVTLRKELMIALKEKKWDDAQKIQTLITARVNELSPPPQVVQTTGGQTIIISPQESSTKHIQIEHIPRYGATDVGRAVGLITRGSSALTPKEQGTLGLLDILLKR